MADGAGTCCHDHSQTNTVTQPTQGLSILKQPTYLKAQALDIFRAAQLGDLQRCQQIVEEAGPQVLLEYDERGHTAMHWACLAGDNDIVRFFIQCSAPLDKPSNNELGPKPIHWACVNGHILTVDLLIQHGISINTTDNRGCTPLIIATQYGKTMLVSYLIGKGARKDFTDIDGDTALHWAAFKGHLEIAQLLIYSGFNPKQKDDVGQTPIHLACLSGSLEMVKFINSKKPDLMLKDNNGKTGLDLARGRSFKDIVSYLEKQMKIDKYCKHCSKVLDSVGQKKYFYLYLFIIVFLTYPFYLYHFNFFYENFTTTNCLFLLFNVPLWYFFMRTLQTNPGYLEQNSSSYDLVLKQVPLHKDWEVLVENNPLSTLCHTCKLVRPERAKHCNLCGRCVTVMDHHCHFMNTCIGVKNRVLFLIYMLTAVVTGLLLCYLLRQLIGEYGWSTFRLLICITYGIVMPLVLLFVFSMLMRISMNLTTNEQLNAGNYTYLRDERGQFRNKYARGVVKNWMEYLHLVPQQAGTQPDNKAEHFSV